MATANYTVLTCSKYPDNLRPCLTALFQHEPEAPVLVVDDGSGTDEMRAAFPSVAWVPGRKPFSFPVNVNIGLRHLGPGRDIMLLNDDAQLRTASGITILRDVAYGEDRLGIVASSCDDVGLLDQRPRGDLTLRYSPMVCFVACYFRAALIADVGLLEEALPGYGYDDNDYCLRARNRGWCIGITERCYFDHGSLPSSFRVRERAQLNQRFKAAEAAYREKWGGMKR